MACPYFFPQQRRDDLVWPHPARLPLGAGFGGTCSAPGFAGTAPSDDELRDGCNLGYAKQCRRLPREREADCARYAVSLDGDQRVVVTWILERDHAPGEHGHAEYDCAARQLTVAPDNARIRRQLECYLGEFLRRKRDASEPQTQADERS